MSYLLSSCTCLTVRPSYACPAQHSGPEVGGRGGGGSASWGPWLSTASEVQHKSCIKLSHGCHGGRGRKVPACLSLLRPSTAPLRGRL